MGLVDRAKNIILTPKTEWPVIETEEPDTGGMITGYALPLMLLPVVGTIIGTGLLSPSGLMYGVAAGLAWLITSLIVIVVAAFIVNVLASSFGSVANQGRAFQLVIYSNTAGWVAGILSIIPVLGGFAAIAGGLYGIYLMYLGLPHTMKTPDDKRVIYVIIVLAVNFLVIFVLGGMILTTVLGILGLSVLSAASAVGQ
ncbi:MAG: Yip1 domain protein [Chlorobi bacterium OLB7]|nr:MAG: Yip1 domain protein [Chlorobi bacterium OLB7]